jgi:hypothetical protein
MLVLGSFPFHGLYALYDAHQHLLSAGNLHLKHISYFSQKAVIFPMPKIAWGTT